MGGVNFAAGVAALAARPVDIRWFQQAVAGTVRVVAPARSRAKVAEHDHSLVIDVRYICSALNITGVRAQHPPGDWSPRWQERSAHRGVQTCSVVGQSDELVPIGCRNGFVAPVRSELADAFGEAIGREGFVERFDR